ncbi:hypothetical protein Syun_017711 [Stephania yunnanensis]|uniref:UBX domain-containing protein n=1 Tax=Stephania yunnanensis TaxID=152371 RepID=A0AAP0J7L5_9MAGN
MHRGRFEQAKQTAAIQDKWLIVNLQSTKEFTSHMLNRDTWGNEAVAQTISVNFIFWQAYDEDNSIEGRKVCTYYKLSSIPVVLLIDPITGQKMKSWNGMIHPDRLLEVLMPFMEGSPKDYLNKRRLPRENFKQPTYPPLPEEPKGVDKSLLCRVALRLPVDGRRCQRTFLRTDPLKLLWSFCSSQLEEANQAHRPFRLTNAIPTASEVLDYESEMTIGESNLENSLIFVTWE